jgi:hypothetical protein
VRTRIGIRNAPFLIDALSVPSSLVSANDDGGPFQLPSMCATVAPPSITPA